MRKTSLLTITLLIIMLQSCYVSKPLESEVRVSLVENVPITINEAAGARFIKAFGREDYQKAFLDGMKISLGFDNVVIDNVNPQFTVTITELELNETLTTDTVNNEKSKDHGRVFDITVAKLKASGTLLNAQDQRSIAWTADKDKKERVTSLQSLGQVITKENEDLDEYRKKDFDKNEYIELSSQCGRRSATVIVNNIKRMMK